MTVSPGPRFAWAVTAAVLGGLLVAALAWAAGVGPRSQDGQPLRPGPVVLVGASGLSWDHIDAATTPTLASWQADGASAALVVRGAHRYTCAADGWLTLSAGQRAVLEAPGQGRTDCPEPPGLPTEAGDTPYLLDGWADWQAAADERAMGAALGSLADGVDGCVRAHGPFAALGAADRTGRVALSPGWPDPADLQECPVHLVDGGVIAGPDDAARLDADLTALTAELSDDATVIVAGLADEGPPGDRAGLRAVVAVGQGSGMLTSPSTRQPGLVQTTDLTATLVALTGATAPELVAGQPVRLLPSAAPVDDRLVRDTAGGGTLSTVLIAPVLGALTLLLLLGLALTTWPGSTTTRAGLRRGTGLRRGMAPAVLATAAMAVPAATFFAGWVPWWRPAGATGTGWTLWVSGLVLALAVAAFTAGLTALAWAGSSRRSVLGPPMVVAAGTMLVLGVDVIWGGRLGLTSVLGVLPISAGRFYGMGNVGAGIVIGAVLVLAGLVAASLHGRAHRSVVAGVVTTLGLTAALIDGLPQWGADFGGVPAIVIATGLLALPAAGIRLSLVRVLLIGLAAVAAAGLLMLLDWLRPADQRTHLGAFVQSVLDGDAVMIVGRKLNQSLGILVNYPVSWLAVVLLAVLAWGVLAPASPPGRVLRPLWQVPLLRQTCIALLVGLVIGWALNDSGISILALGLAVAVSGLLAILLRLPASAIQR